VLAVIIGVFLGFAALSVLQAVIGVMDIGFAAIGVSAHARVVAAHWLWVVGFILGFAVMAGGDEDRWLSLREGIGNWQSVLRRAAYVAALLLLLNLDDLSPRSLENAAYAYRDSVRAWESPIVFGSLAAILLWHWLRRRQTVPDGTRPV
jgi:hypothetical protein